MATDNSNNPIVIKKYANRRLYNTSKSSYVTLDDLAQMVRDGLDFVVKDAKSGADITRSVLTQIIFEEESKGQNLLPIKFLRQLIGFYGDSLEGFVPGYLDESMAAFTRNQDQLREQVSAAVSTNPVMANFENMARGNMEWMENAIKMFSPYAAAQASQENRAEPTADTPQNSELDTLKTQLSEMQAQLAKLVGNS